MVRRTKEEAQATRGRIIDAAERVFQSRGFGATSLHDVAQAAGVTRGAVYWHFKDKTDLFDAMLSRVTLPLEAASNAVLDAAGAPLTRLRDHVALLFGRIENDEQTRRVFDIVTTRVEYVDELSALRERRRLSCDGYRQRLQALLEQAQHERAITVSDPPRELALGLFALIDGLIQNWVFDPTAFALQSTALRAVDHHLAGLGAQRTTPSVKPTRV